MSGIASAKLADFIFTLALAGIERGPVLEEIRKKRDEGATDDQITDHLRNMYHTSDRDAQSEIDKLPGDPPAT